MTSLGRQCPHASERLPRPAPTPSPSTPSPTTRSPGTLTTVARSDAPARPPKAASLRARGQRTMRRLLDAGITVFAARGYHSARVDDIVKAAKTSHGTFYLYFANKEDLFQALVTDVATELTALATVARRSGTDRDRSGRAARLARAVRGDVRTLRARHPHLDRGRARLERGRPHRHGRTRRADRGARRASPRPPVRTSTPNSRPSLRSP